MFKKCSMFAAMVLCIYFLAACSPPPPGAASFTLISDQTDKNRKFYSSVGTPVEGKDCFTMLFIYVWFGIPPVEETLLAKVLGENNADALIDAEFKHSFSYFPILFSRQCLTVSGTPVKLKKTL